jgi:hypothetical protein
VPVVVEEPIGSNDGRLGKEPEPAIGMDGRHRDAGTFSQLRDGERAFQAARSL